MINRIYHGSWMGTEKFQPEGKLIMPETRFTSSFWQYPMTPGWDFLVCIGDRRLIIFLTHEKKKY